MLTYTYTALNPASGEKIQAQIEAENEKSAAKLLIERGLSPLDIEIVADKPGAAFRSRVPTKEKVLFSRQLSTLINSGLPLIQSLNIVRNQTKQKNLKIIIGKIISDIEAGSSLAVAMQKFPSVFNNVYISLVAAGEASGSLDKSLERLASQQEKDAEVIGKVRGAMIYPAIVLLVLFAIMIFMTTTVLPQVANIYKSLPGASLPFVTKLLLGFSSLLTHFWWLALILLVVGGYFLKNYIKTGAGRSQVDGLKMRTPPIGPLFMKLYMARFARTASTLIGAGVPMIKMLQTTAEAVGNTHITNSILKAVDQVKGGKSLSASIKDDSNFLELVPDMISIGEQSGALETMLERVADYYEKEVDSQIKAINTIIEPVMMIIVGIIALVIVAAVLLPIYGLAGKNLGG
jgi:type IV pilus assembly protein PilC